MINSYMGRICFEVVGCRKVTNMFLLLFIALRFALLEAKVALAKLVLKAEMEIAPGHEEVALESANALLRPKEGVELVLKPITGM